MQQNILSQLKTSNVNLKDDVGKFFSLTFFFQLFTLNFIKLNLYFSHSVYQMKV